MNEIFRKLGAELHSRDSPESSHRFQIPAGMFFFPEGRCPYCQGSIRSNRIWKLRRASVEGVWKLSGRGRRRKVLPIDLYGMTSIHPHVSGRSVCMGENPDAATALFLGMYPRGAYWTRRDRWFNWLLRTWNHDCPEDMRSTTLARREAARLKRESEAAQPTRTRRRRQA